MTRVTWGLLRFFDRLLLSCTLCVSIQYSCMQMSPYTCICLAEDTWTRLRVCSFLPETEVSSRAVSVWHISQRWCNMTHRTALYSTTQSMIHSRWAASMTVRLTYISPPWPQSSGLVNCQWLTLRGQRWPHKDVFPAASYLPPLLFISFIKWIIGLSGEIGWMGRK